MDMQEASKVIAIKLEEIANLVRECEEISMKHGIGFNMDLGGYGMGGYFDGEDWISSSQSC